MDCGEDKERFIDLANEYIPVKLKIEEDGGIDLCEVNEKGQFFKKIERVSPKDIVFWKGMFLTCSYKKGEFNPDWVYSQTLSLETCTGPLKDIIDELMADDLG